MKSRGDAERLQWIEDQLWNGWTINPLKDDGDGYSGPPWTVWDPDLKMYEGETFRNAIDAAMDATDAD